MDTSEWVKPVVGDLLSPRICHALGALTINWNLCEDLQSRLITTIARSHIVTMELVLAGAANNTKANLLADLCEAFVKEPDETALETFNLYYSICLENRNTLVHSLIFPEDYDKDKDLKFVRVRKRFGTRDRFLDCTPEIVEEVVRDTAFLFSFGTRICTRLAGDRQTELLRPLPKPRKLLDILPVQKGAPRQP